MSSDGPFDTIADRSGGRTFSIAEISRPTSKSKRESLTRILKTERYDSQWPATVIHEFRSAEVFADRDAAADLG